MWILALAVAGYGDTIFSGHLAKNHFLSLLAAQTLALPSPALNTTGLIVATPASQGAHGPIIPWPHHNVLGLCATTPRLQAKTHRPCATQPQVHAR